MWWNLVEQSGTNMKSTNKKECNIEKSINTPWKYSSEKVDDKVPMWHQKDGITTWLKIMWQEDQQITQEMLQQKTN